MLEESEKDSGCAVHTISTFTKLKLADRENRIPSPGK